MPNTQTGLLLIADITGYTTYLSQSELEHAQEVLQSLLEILIEHTRIPLIISRLEGDAVISHAPAGSFLQGATLLELIESAYVAFKRAIQLMMVNTTCSCNACKNIPNLDLKFFIHAGAYGLQALPSYTELIGNEVNLVHRLTKNQVTEKTGLRAYALFTRAAIEMLEIEAIAAEMIAHTENYEQFGEIQLFIVDMGAVWDRERDRTRLRVRPEESILIMEHDFPVAPVHLWDYLLLPEYRALFIDSDTADAKHLREGRIGSGTVYQCAHGRLVHPQTIVDWRPFEEHTIYDQVSKGLSTYVTYRLAPTDNGSRLKIIVGPVQSQNPLKRIMAGAILRFLWRTLGPRGVRKLRQQIEQDLAEGRTLRPDAVELDTSEIRNSIKNALV